MPTPNPGLKIGLDTLFLDGGGSSLANFVVELASHLVATAADETYVIFGTSSTLEFFRDIKGPHVQFVVCPFDNQTRLRRILYQQLRLPAMIRRHSIDVTCCLADVAPLSTRVPILLKVNTLHHYRTPEAIGRLRRFYRTLMVGASARKASLVIANSTATAADIQRFLGVPDSKVRLIYEAVSDTFGPLPRSESLWSILRVRYSVRPPYLLFVSALYPYKNLKVAIRAMGRLAGGYGWPGTLVVAGGDPYGVRHESEDLAESLGLRERVLFLGSVPNVALRELYCGADALLYPSASETFGKPVVEAMRCETPIVASNAGSIPEIVQDAAILTEPEDDVRIADETWALIRDPAKQAALRAAGRRRAADFSWEAVASSFRKALEEAAAMRAGIVDR